MLIFIGDDWNKRGRPGVFRTSGSQDAFQPLITTDDSVDDSDDSHEFQPLQQRSTAPVQATLTS